MHVRRVTGKRSPNAYQSGFVEPFEQRDVGTNALRAPNLSGSPLIKGCQNVDTRQPAG
jgi:hypothetical protein